MSGSVRGLIVTSEPILQQKVDCVPYSTTAVLTESEGRVLLVVLRKVREKK